MNQTVTASEITVGTFLWPIRNRAERVIRTGNVVDVLFRDEHGSTRHAYFTADATVRVAR